MKSIRNQLTVRLVSGCALLWGLCGLGVYLAVRGSLIAEFDHALLAKAQGLAALTERHNSGRVHIELNNTLMPEFAATAGADYFELWDKSRNWVVRSESLGKRDLPEGVNRELKMEVWDFALTDGGPMRGVRMRYLPDIDEDDDGDWSGKSVNSEVSLVVASSRAGIDHFLGLLGAMLIGSEVLVLAGTAGLATLIVRRGLAPLVVLAERAKAIDMKAPGTRFPTEGMPAELQPICLRLNDSLGRLEESFERERQFSSDVAHELRTPIAELRAMAEVALRWPDEAGPEHGFETALQIALQMEAIVTQLLALMRCESGLQATRREPIQVAEMVRRCWLPFEADALGKGLEVSFEIPEDLSIESDPTLVSGIFSNLLSNAVAYTPMGGRIDIEPSGEGEESRIVVRNSVEDVSESDLGNFFNRYWRKDAARDAAAHNGLGLPLARSFAEALGLRLEAGMVAEDMVELRLSKLMRCRVNVRE